MFDCGSEFPHLLRELCFNRILHGTYLYKEEEKKTRVFKRATYINT